MKLKLDNSDKILSDFRKRWTLPNPEVITLKGHVNINNKDTFCYWVETKTISLGSIKGFPSNKFGIYKRGINIKAPVSGDFIYDEEYIWRKKFGKKIGMKRLRQSST